MGQLFKLLTSLAWLLLCVVLTVQSADAQKRYPSVDDPWDSTDYRALAERVERDGLALPTLADPATKPVFERMVSVDNMPLHVGLNKKLALAVRFQRLDSTLQPLRRLEGLYSSEIKKGKRYATELAVLMVYESKIFGALLDLSEPFLSSLPKDRSYQYQVANMDQVKSSARQIYSGLVQGMTETSVYSKPDTLKMIGGALAELPHYLPIFSNQDSQGLAQRLTQQISKTSDQELKTALTELRDAIENRRIRT